MTNTRTTLSVELKPIVGSRFQPTGFPDLGAATFTRSGGDGESLIVESVQSMANRLEALTWDVTQNDQVELLRAIPYVRVVDTDGNFLTSSRLEAHRLASPYILSATQDGKNMGDQLQQAFGLVKGLPLDNARVAQEIFRLDPLCLIHGVFFAQTWAWQPKISRATTLFIEAAGAMPALSGGVKKDGVINESDAKSGHSAKEGYGSVPHHRTEYTAQRIELFGVIDEQQLASYGLGAERTEFLSALASWQVAALLDGGLRLRTACDLVPAAPPQDFPSLDAATKRLTKAISKVDDFGSVTEVTWAKKADKSSKQD